MLLFTETKTRPAVAESASYKRQKKKGARKLKTNTYQQQRDSPAIPRILKFARTRPFLHPLCRVNQQRLCRAIRCNQWSDLLLGRRANHHNLQFGQTKHLQKHDKVI